MDLNKKSCTDYLEMEKNGSNFGDLDLIFRIIEGQRMLVNDLSATNLQKVSVINGL